MTILFPNIGEGRICIPIFIDVSHNSDLSSFANIHDIAAIITTVSYHITNDNRSNNMSGIGTCSGTTRSGLSNHYLQRCRIFVNRSCKDRLCCVRNRVTVLIPLEDQIVRVIISKMCSSRNFTTDTNRIII